jgi:ABC-type multidrug transport system fused ATPase/permease subunit
VQLINRYYDPKEGEIMFDGNKITDVSLEALRESIGYVSQEPVLILGTIRENLMYGNSQATEAQMQAALELASA